MSSRMQMLTARIPTAQIPVPDDLEPEQYGVTEDNPVPPATPKHDEQKEEQKEAKTALAAANTYDLVTIEGTVGTNGKDEKTAETRQEETEEHPQEKYNQENNSAAGLEKSKRRLFRMRDHKRTRCVLLVLTIIIGLGCTLGGIFIIAAYNCLSQSEDKERG